VSTFPLRWRRCPFVASDFRRRTCAFAHCAFCLLPVTHHCWTSVSQLSMGCSALGDRLFVDLSRAMAAMAAGADVVAAVIRLRMATARQGNPGYSLSGLTGRFVL